jgi:hypothetical protein
MEKPDLGFIGIHFPGNIRLRGTRFLVKENNSVVN